MFTLNKGDWMRGLAVAVGGSIFVAVSAVIGTIINTPGFDVFSVDWVTLGHTIINLVIVSAYAGLAGYISKNLFTSDQGNLLKIGDTK